MQVGESRALASAGVAHAAADTLEAGREALLRHAWREGYELLEDADAAAPLSPEDLEGLAAAAWWTGRLEACISARERAFAGYMDAQNRRRAAIIAMAVAKDHYAKRASSIGTAWMTRAERLLADEPECVEQGYLERLLSVIAFEGRGDFEAALGHGRRALEIGTRFGDRDLQALALHDQGRALVAKGDVAKGMAMIDEATVAAVSGELSPYHTGVIYCNTITACKELADYRRAGDWSEAAKRWCERQAIAGFPGMCRVYRASIMRVRGAWPEAELEARRACDELMGFNLGYAAEAFYELGEIRMRRGDLVAAQAAFTQAHELGRDPEPGLALLRLAEGKIDGARACIDQALDEESRDLHRARLLPAQVEIALAAGDLAKARAAADELTAIGQTYESGAFEAAACSARSRIALEEGNAHPAVRDIRHALRLWQEIGAPFEAAQARMLLALAYLAEGNTDSGALELQAAANAFEKLGAVPDARRAYEQLESLGVRPSTIDAVEGSQTRTFMFTDIVRSTSLVEAIGDDAWAELARWHDQTLRLLFVEHGGEEIDHAGDGFFVAFADPSAAVDCAVAVQRTLFQHRRAHGFAPQVRIGLHIADAARHGAGYRGKGVHEAARIAALAEGGEILASAKTLAGTTLRFSASTPRSVELKGVSEPVELIAINWQT
jgi:class 3 adenylate cyclase